MANFTWSGGSFEKESQTINDLANYGYITQNEARRRLGLLEVRHGRKKPTPTQPPTVAPNPPLQVTAVPWTAEEEGVYEKKRQKKIVINMHSDQDMKNLAKILEKL